MPLRQSVFAKARRVVVKMGTQLLTAPSGKLDVPFFETIAGQVAELRRKGIEVTIVSSGAIGAGCSELKLGRRPADVAQLQAVAAAGQPRLMSHLAAAFEKHGLLTAQLLLTRGDFDDRLRFLNIRNCVAQLHRYGAVPIVNENDTVAVDEIRFGDNDMLAALLSNALRADVLVLLTVVEGLLDGKGAVIDLVSEVSAVTDLARREKSALGTGGMTSKLQAARLVTEAGEVAVIANGRTPSVLPRLLSGERVGTVFAPAPRLRKLDSRRRWIGLTKRPAGIITIDSGAAAALRGKGRSLLAIGILSTSGEFDRGQVVSVQDAVGVELGRGLTNYSSEELPVIIGHKSSQFEKLLGRPAYAEVIHRDNLVLVSHGGEPANNRP